MKATWISEFSTATRNRFGKFAGFGLCLLLMSTTFSGSAVAQNRLMPLGNSITEGLGSTNQGGYRFGLYNLLKGDGHFFDFVGSRTSGIGFPDTDHEGHPAFTAQDIRRNVLTYMTNSRPSHVFLHIGTNDIHNGASAEPVRDEISNILDVIFDFNNRTEIYLATLVPRRDAKQAVNLQLNNLIKQQVAARFGQGFNIYVVDMNAAFTSVNGWETSLMQDDLHPNDDGYEIMARAWYEAYALNNVPTVPEFADEFNRATLGDDWSAAASLVLRSGELVNNSTVDNWNQFIAIPTVINNPRVVEFEYGQSSDATGRAFTGVAVMLNETNPTQADGYLLFHNFDKIRLHELRDGVPVSPPIEILDAQAPEPVPGDLFRVEIDTDNLGHKFTISINGVFDGILRDPDKKQGSVKTLYAGVQLHGNTDNSINKVFFSTRNDLVNPGDITDLAVESVTASTVALRFTAPGDDGDFGAAARYDVRYAESPITAGTVNNATPATGIPTPSIAGTVETVRVSNLDGGKTYYFAIRAFDEVGNSSNISNVVQANTPALATSSDKFNRLGPGLGSDWKADIDLQLFDGTVQNTTTTWQRAVYLPRKNAREVAIVWGPEIDIRGTLGTGILALMDSPNPTANGYFIQYDFTNKVVNLWYLANGNFSQQLDSGRLLSDTQPKPGSSLRIEVNVTASFNSFKVFVDGKLEREVADFQKLANGEYAGFMMDGLGAGNLNSNAIDEFQLSTAIQPAASLRIESGNDQIGTVETQLPEPLVVKVLDKDANPVPGANVNFQVTVGSATVDAPSSPDGNLRIEAESGNIQAPIQTRDDANAARGKFITYPAGFSQDATATFTFEIKTAGTYFIWTRSLKKPSAAGSWTISVDRGQDFVYDVFQGKTNAEWTWDLMSKRGHGTSTNPEADPVGLTLAAGTHTIEFKARHDETWLDKFIVTSDHGFVPQGLEDTGLVTDGLGLAQASVMLGSKAGPVTIQAIVGSLAPVTFNAFVTGGAPAALTLAKGNNQTGKGGDPLPDSLQVKVTDLDGNLVPGVQVSWDVTEGDGKLSAYKSVTDLRGLASSILTLSSTGAVNKVVAFARKSDGTALSGSPLAFTAITTSGLATRIQRASDNNLSGQAGSTISTPIAIRITDANGNGVANYPAGFTAQNGGKVLAAVSIQNNAFEDFDANSLPLQWSLEGSPNTAEVKTTTGAPFEGKRSLEVNTNRNNVGVTQNLQYAENTTYLLSFRAKVLRGTLRVLWRTTDGNGQIVDNTTDILQTDANSDWTLYQICASNGKAGQRGLFFRSATNARFFLDDVRVMPVTDKNGRLQTNWTLGDTAGAQTAQIVALNGSTPLAGSPIIFNATANAGPAALLKTQHGNNQVGSAGQALSDSLVVKVADATGVNGVAGVGVTFRVASGGGLFENNTATITKQTRNDGTAFAKYTLGPTTGVQNVVEASASGLTGSPLAFVAIAAVPASLAKITGDDQRGSVGYPVEVPLTVRVSDNDGNTISGFPVQFEVTQGGGSINGKTKATIATNDKGLASARLICGPTPGGLNRVDASVIYNGEHISGSPRNFKVRNYGVKNLDLDSGENQSGVVGEFLQRPLSVVVRDSSDRGVGGQIVNFKILEGGAEFSGNVAEVKDTTDAGGVASARLKLGTKPGVSRVSASTSPAITGSPITFNATARVGPPSKLAKVSGDSLSGVAGNQLTTPIVTLVTDRFGNAVHDANVIFEVIKGGGSINGRNLDTIKTNASGRAQAFLTLGPSAGSLNNEVTARAFNGSIELTNSPIRFVASATASTAQRVDSFDGNRQTGQAAELLTDAFRVRVQDRNGNIVENYPVRFKVIHGGGNFFSDGGDVGNDTTVATNEFGIAKLRYRLGGVVAPDSQVVHAFATNGSVPLAGSPVVFVANATAGVPDASRSYVAATGSTPADGVTSMEVSVFVRDNFGNPVPNQSAIIAVTNGPNDIKQPDKKTDKNGVTRGSFSSTRAGLKMITAQIPSGISINVGATVQFLPLDATQINAVDGNNQTGNINTAVAEPFVVKVGDRFNNGVPLHPVSFTVKSGGGSMHGDGKNGPSVTVMADASGFASASLIFGNQTGQSQVWAESENLSNSPIIFIASAVERPARELSRHRGNDQTGVAGETLPDSIVALVTDESGSPVSGTPVNFEVTFGGGQVSAARVLSDVFGRASVAWRLGSEAGLNVARARADGLNGSPVDFRASAIGGRPCCLAINGGSFAGPVGGQSNPITVKVSDAAGNGIDGVTVQFELIAGTGSLTRSQDVTKNGGIAATQINFDLTSGSRTVRASSTGLAGSPLTIGVTAAAESPVAMTAVTRTNNQGGTINQPLNFPLQVKLVDRYGNPAPGHEVDFVITAGGGFLNNTPGTPVAQARTNGDGIAGMPLTLGASPGTNRVSAIKEGLSSGSTIEFVATGNRNNFPIFETVAPQQVIETNRMEFKVRASDADGDPLTYGAQDLPPGAAFDSLSSLVFTWQPGFEDAGIYEPAIIVRDDKGGIDIEIVRIDVINRNRPPQILGRSPIGNGDPAIPDTTLPVDNNGAGRMTMRVFASDPDGDALFYNWRFNGFPTGNNSPSYSFVSTEMWNEIRVTVSDGQEEVQTVWRIKVPVELVNFAARGDERGRVKIFWNTGSETHNAGFNVLRSRSRWGEYIRVNAGRIAPNAAGIYEYIDADVNAGERYFYKLEQIDVNGATALHGPIEATVAPPAAFFLSQNYPNPFNPSTNIQYHLPKAAMVKLTVYNSLGQLVKQLANRQEEAGYYVVTWNGRDRAGNLAPSGVYHYRLEAGDHVETRKMILTK